MASEKISQRETLPTFKTPTPAPLISRIGNYKIESLLHKGSMSFLYLAKDLESQKLVAIKILRPELAQTKELVDRFILESKIIAKASHQNVVSVYECGKWEKGLFIAMEYIQGVTLTQFMKGHLLSKRRALEIIIKVGYGLMHLHSHKIIHRDLKPENIMINEEGEVKIIDFGIAEVMKSVRSTHGFATRPVIGTPSYMSPEQKKNPLSVSYNTDIYSLGVITYELLIGKLCFGKINLSLVDEKIRPILEGALHLDFHQRTPDIVDFITQIASYLRKEASLTTTTSLKSISKQLLAGGIPKYDELEIGFCTSEAQAIPNIYYDFFHLVDGSYFILLANLDKEADALSFLPIINMRGITHALLNPYLHNSEIKEFSLTNFARELNEILFHDKLHKNVFSTLLHIHPLHNTIEHITSMEEGIYHLPSKGNSPRLLLNRTPPLGSTLEDVFYPTSDTFSSQDICLLHSFSKPHLSEDQKANLGIKTTQTLTENKFSQSGSLAKTMFNTLEVQTNDSDNFCLAIYRL